VTASLQFIPPCCPIPVKAVPIGKDWQHEAKFDGYRVQVHKTGKDVAIYSRNGHVFTSRFETIAHMIRELPARSVKTGCST
jgi:bifunctional non-homologous end joining protein LigD